MREDIKLKPFDQSKHEASFQAIADEVDTKVLDQMLEIAKNYKEPGIPKEKAKEIYCKYIDAYGERNLQVCDYMFAKQCALIAVDEIIKSKPHEWDGCDYYSMEDYWKQVLIEINKL